MGDWLYRGCHSAEEFLRILLYRTAGGWKERITYGRSPTTEEATAVSKGGRECTTKKGNGERGRDWNNKTIVEYAESRQIAQSFTRYGLIEIFEPGQRNWTGGGEGIVTYVCEPLLFPVIGFKGQKNGLEQITSRQTGKFLYAEVKQIIADENLGYLSQQLEIAKQKGWTM